MSLKRNYYGFDHKAVNKRFTGDLTYLNDFCVNDEYYPISVYKVANPDRSKGHKDYMLLQSDPLTKGGLVRGMSEEEINKWCYQDGIKCHSCDDIIYSVNRHDYTHCKCGKVNVDGGKDYLKIGFESNAIYTIVNINLLTDEVKDVPTTT